MNKKLDARGQVTEWISSGVIADQLAESLQSRGLPVTVANMKGLWLAALEYLPSTIEVVPDSRIESEAAAIEKAEELKKTMED